MGSVTTSEGDDLKIKVKSSESITVTLDDGNRFADVVITYLNKNWSGATAVNDTSGDGTEGNGKDGIYTFTPGEEYLDDVGYLVVVVKARTDWYMYDIVEIVPEGKIIVDKPAAGDKVQYNHFNIVLYDIEWRKSGFTGEKVNIYLYKGDGNNNYELIREILKEIENDGNATWHPIIHDGYGNDYKIFIIDSINTANFSEQYTILKPKSKTHEITLERTLELIKDFPIFQKFIKVISRINNIFEIK